MEIPACIDHRITDISRTSEEAQRHRQGIRAEVLDALARTGNMEAAIAAGSAMMDRVEDVTVDEYLELLTSAMNGPSVRK